MAIGFDQRGTGRSYVTNPDTHNVTVDLIISDIEHIRQSLQIEEWTILGHAFGGLLAAHYTMKYPSRVNRLVLSNVQSLNLDSAQRIENCIDDLLGKKRSRVLKNLKLYSYFPLRKRDYYFKTMAYVYDKTFVHIASKWLSSSKSNISLLLRFSTSKNQSKYPEILRSYERPVLLIYGSHDIVPLADAIENSSYFANG